MKGGTLDIESYPRVVRTFGNDWDARIMKEDRPVLPASFSFVPWGKGKIVTRGIWQYEDPKEFMWDLWRVYNDNDFLIGHNIKRFDERQSNAFFAYYDLPSPSKVEFIDTLTVVRSKFKLPSNSLKYCLEFFRIGAKIETGGADLWFGAESGNERDQKKMLQYNQNDSVQNDLLARYLIEKGWLTPPWNKYYIPGNGCIRCGEEDMQSRGKDIPRAEGLVSGFMCKKCGKRNYTEPHTKWNSCAPV